MFQVQVETEAGLNPTPNTHTLLKPILRTNQRAKVPHHGFLAKVNMAGSEPLNEEADPPN